MSYDIIIRNGKIIDGAGNPWYYGEIGVRDGKITKIRSKIKENAKNEIDATGLIVCPGFIDIHSHTDYFLPVSTNIESSIHQGITTSVVGMCGDGMAPIPHGKEEEFIKVVSIIDPILAKMKYPYHTYAEYLNYIDTLQNLNNFIFFIGYNNLRFAGGEGNENRPANSKELESMKNYLREAMEAGAFGMSTGLIYAPQVFSKTDELIELSKVVAEYNGLYFSHIRGEGENVINAVKEVVEIVEKSGCAGGQIAHHKVSGERYWGKSKDTLKVIEEANERGISITCDQYPYNRGMSGLVSALPPWAQEGKNEKILERIQDPKIQARIKKDVKEGIKNWENWIRDEGFKKMYIASVASEEWQDIIGKNVSEITKIKGLSDDWATYFILLIENKLGVNITIESMGEEDIRRIMTSRYQMVGTDGFGLPQKFGTAKFHPRCFGTYPRILGKYVREEKLLTLENAIRKMTSFPAQRLGLKDRGLLLEGNWADVVVFNSDIIKDNGTYDDPHQFPDGIEHVLVNGELVIENGKKTRSAPGRVLRHTV